MKTVWLLWNEDKEGWFVAAVYDDEVRADEDLRQYKKESPNSRHYIQEKRITK